MVDADLNRDPSAVDTSTATVTIASVGSDGICADTGFCYPMSASVTLREMSADSPFFTGVLLTTATEQVRRAQFYSGRASGWRIILTS